MHTHLPPPVEVQRPLEQLVVLLDEGNVIFILLRNLLHGNEQALRVRERLNVDVRALADAVAADEQAAAVIGEPVRHIPALLIEHVAAEHTAHEDRQLRLHASLFKKELTLFISFQLCVFRQPAQVFLTQIPVVLPYQSLCLQETPSFLPHTYKNCKHLEIFCH